MTQLNQTVAGLCRFQTGYGEASIIATSVAEDLGMGKVKITKKKIRTQMKKICAAAVQNLDGVTVKG